MGIPGAVSKIVNKYNKKHDGNIVTNAINSDVKKKIHFFIDFNGALYYCVHKYKPKTNDELIKQVCSYIDSVANLYMKSNNNDSDNSDDSDDSSDNNSDNVELATYYISLDGVPPRAKMEQQRTRRFHSVENKERSKYIFENFASEDEVQLIKSIGNESCLDTNSFTPGTEFMDMLNLAITKHFTDSKKYNNVNVHFSGSDVPMEGEHKLFNYIKENRDKYGENDIIIVYGLDADLIMLSMISRVNNIYLLREKTEFGKQFDTFEHDNNQYLYFDIDLLKTAIIEELSDEVGEIRNNEINNYINDFVVLYFILGNDFVPKIPWLSLDNCGHEKLLDAYYKVHIMRREFLTKDPKATIKNKDKLRLNNELLIHLFETLASNEKDEMIDYHDYRQKKRIYYDKSMTKYEKKCKTQKFYPLTRLDMEERVQPDQRNWFYRYYQVCFRWKRDETNMNNINNVVISYLESIYWTFQYYFSGKVPSWSWYSPYHYGPLCGDIMRYINSYKDTRYKVNTGYDINRIKFQCGTPIKPQELLFMVLPYHSRNLMSIEVKKNLEKIIHMVEKKLMDNFTINQREIYKSFPDRYSISIPYHTFYWECRAIIKHFKYDDVKEFFKGIKLTKDEIKRNKFGVNKIWKSNEDINTDINININIRDNILSNLDVKIEKIFKPVNCEQSMNDSDSDISTKYDSAKNNSESENTKHKKYKKGSEMINEIKRKIKEENDKK